jgi:hypothetical protein
MPDGAEPASCARCGFDGFFASPSVENLRCMLQSRPPCAPPCAPGKQPGRSGRLVSGRGRTDGAPRPRRIFPESGAGPDCIAGTGGRRQGWGFTAGGPASDRARIDQDSAAPVTQSAPRNGRAMAAAGVPFRPLLARPDIC